VPKHISITLFNIPAVFTLGKLMNVKEDYGELSSIARSVLYIHTMASPLYLVLCHAILFFFKYNAILILLEIHAGKDLGVHAAVYTVDLSNSVWGK
jgi:hypothetical protein